MRDMKTMVMALVLAGLMFAGAALAADDGWVEVSWTFATTNEDGSPLTDLAGAKVYYGTSSSNYVSVLDVPGGTPGGTSTARVTGLKPGVTYFLNGTAYSTAGLESDFCDEVAKTVPLKPGKHQKGMKADKAGRGK